MTDETRVMRWQLELIGGPWDAEPGFYVLSEELPEAIKVGRCRGASCGSGEQCDGEHSFFWLDTEEAPHGATRYTLADYSDDVWRPIESLDYAPVVAQGVARYVMGSLDLPSRSTGGRRREPVGAA